MAYTSQIPFNQNDQRSVSQVLISFFFNLTPKWLDIFQKVTKIDLNNWYNIGSVYTYVQNYTNTNNAEINNSMKQLFIEHTIWKLNGNINVEREPKGTI